MAIYLDDEPIQIDGLDLESVLSAAKDLLAGKGRIVVEVQVDGQSLVEDALGQQYDKAVDGAEVRLYSADPKDLAVVTLEQLRDKLQDARTAQSQASELLQQDKLGLAMKEVVRVIEVWQQTQQAVLQSAQLLGVDLDARKVKGRSVPEMTDALLEQVLGLRNLLQVGDTVGLSDAMAYEWPETVDRWEAFIVHLIGWIKEDFNDDASE